MITIGFIRHGTTEWNLAGRMQGQMDTPLAEAGRHQAERIAERLRGESWDGIWSSDLKRALETAECIASMTGIPLLGTDARLRERSFGQLEGTTLEERISRWGTEWRELDLGLESDESLLLRWSSFLEELEESHEGKRMLVVSHGGYIVPIVESIRQEKLEQHLMNTSLTVMVKHQSEGWSFPVLNCTRHLP
ncbi:histidine phosphatase family protein [Paenibacillus sp. YYML68]|uniref:histidine phosphatase family protein n=1 Tax=Paenibacillus sp. YYML68 TaxID=2909250 RepID=UPI0024928AD7|nr:histidine phosphatase family protein [Paenibacillus sp. YYML68]